MKINSYLLLLLVLFFSYCGNDAENVPIPINKIKNENMLVKALLYNDWMTVSSLHSGPYDNLRNTVIHHLDTKTNSPLSSLQAMDDNHLSWAALMYKFLLESTICTAQQLLTMTLDDCRNTLIIANVNNTTNSTAYCQSKNNADNLRMAYQWWFKNNLSTRTIISKLNDVAGSNPIYNIKDHMNRGMDVLRMVKADENYTYLGVYHQIVSGTTNFKLYLSGSNDLQHWTSITELGDRSHQGDIEKWGSGYIIANEQDIVHGSNNIRVRYYASYANLVSNNPSFDKTIDRLFAPTAEGTPDIRKIEGSSPANSYIVIGFHYFENRAKDQLAFGILKNFTEWKAWKDVISNQNIQKMGYNGNIGGRDYFKYSNSDYVLQEAQITSGDWGGWRLLLGNGVFYYTLRPITWLNSTSFANPGVLSFGQSKLAVTSFMHSAGNKPEEVGELIYYIDY